MDDGIIFYVQYTSVLFIVVKQHSKKLGGKLIVIIMYHFENEG